jgi:hypothetical protein
MTLDVDLKDTVDRLVPRQCIWRTAEKFCWIMRLTLGMMTIKPANSGLLFAVERQRLARRVRQSIEHRAPERRRSDPPAGVRA